jgi:hypothetical protein
VTQRSQTLFPCYQSHSLSLTLTLLRNASLICTAQHMPPSSVQPCPLSQHPVLTTPTDSPAVLSHPSSHHFTGLPFPRRATTPLHGYCSPQGSRSFARLPFPCRATATARAVVTSMHKKWVLRIYSGWQCSATQALIVHRGRCGGIHVHTHDGRTHDGRTCGRRTHSRRILHAHALWQAHLASALMAGALSHESATEACACMGYMAGQ